MSTSQYKMCSHKGKLIFDPSRPPIIPNFIITLIIIICIQGHCTDVSTLLLSLRKINSISVSNQNIWWTNFFFVIRPRSMQFRPGYSNKNNNGKRMRPLRKWSTFSGFYGEKSTVYLLFACGIFNKRPSLGIWVLGAELQPEKIRWVEETSHFRLLSSSV